MKKINLNAAWEYWPKGHEEQSLKIDLPHDAMIHRERIHKLKNGSYTGFYPSGDYVYKKLLYGEEEYRDQSLILEFEGVYMYSTVYLNGEKLGGHVYGYSNFYIDLTEKLHIGENNELLVEAHCSQVPNARWYPGNGIYRPVWLHVGNRSHIALDGVQVVTEEYDPPRIRVKTQTVQAEDCEVAISVLDGDKVIAEGASDDCVLSLHGAKLWSDEHPCLYKAVIVLQKDVKVLDRQEISFGIRKLAWSAETGLTVNGERTLLRGGCVHHDNGILGACDFEAASFRKIRILKEAGFNAIRSAHYPIGKSMLKACDELGMYVMDEAFDNWREPTGQYGYTLEFEDEWRDDLIKMVLKDRNHPSVVMYSIGNEISDTAKPAGVKLAGEMTELCRALDDTRPVLVCPNLFMNMLSTMGMNFSLGEGKELSKDDVTDPTLEAPDSELGGSVAINFLVMTGPTLMNLLLTPKRSEKGVGPVYEKVDIAGYNYGTKVYEGHHRMNPDRIIVGSETHPADIAQTWPLVEKNPYIIGDFMWTAWDYLGEVGVGLVQYGKSAGAYIKPYPTVSAYTGAIDLIGHRDLYSHLAAIVWGRESGPYIAVQPLNHAGEKKHFSLYRKTDAFESWSWPGYEGAKTAVEVYSAGNQVELMQDGKSLGRKQLKDHKAVFPVVYRPGVLEAVSYDDAGNELNRAALRSAGTERRITVAADRATLKANGEDLAYIDIALTDDNGIVHVLDETAVSVTVEGCGTLQGLGTGNPQPEEPYDGKVCTCYQGRAQAVIRAGRDAGEICVTISADGCESVSMHLYTEAKRG